MRDDVQLASVLTDAQAEVLNGAMLACVDRVLRDCDDWSLVAKAFAFARLSLEVYAADQSQQQVGELVRQALRGKPADPGPIDADPGPGSIPDDAEQLRARHQPYFNHIFDANGRCTRCKATFRCCAARHPLHVATGECVKVGCTWDREGARGA